EAVQAQLLNIAAGELPLVLASELLAHVDDQDRQERLATDADVIQGLLLERDRQLIDLMRDARAPSALISRATRHLEADRASRQVASPVQRRLDLSEGARSLLRQLRGTRLKALRELAEELVEKHLSIAKEREDLERTIAATPDETDIVAVLDKFKKATQAF